MRIRKLMLMAAMAAGLLSAQETKKEDAPEAVIIPVRTLSGDSFKRLVALLSVFNARLTADDKLRTIVVYAPKDVVAEVRRVVQELDRPGSEAALGRNIEMTMTLLRCSTKPPAAGAAPLPAELEPVAKQLRAATQYKDIQIWDIVPLHLQEGKVTEETLRLPSPATSQQGAFATATIRLGVDAVMRKDQGRFVRFDSVRINFRIPYPTPPGQLNYADVGVSTAGDFMEGQKTVLGKVAGPEDESAIFVVIALKVLE